MSVATTHVFVKTSEEGAPWVQRSFYQDHPEHVRERMQALLKQDYQQGGAASMPWRVLLVTLDPERPAQAKVVEYKVELIEPRLVKLP